MSAYSDYIAKIAREIDAELKNEPSTYEIPEFPDPPLGFSAETSGIAVPQHLNGVGNDMTHLQLSMGHVQCLKNGQVLLYRDLTSYHKSLQKIVIFCKRVIRKLVRFVLEPIVAEVNQNRMVTAAAIEELQQHMAVRAGYADSLNAAIGEIETLRQENQMLKRRLEKMEERVNTLEKRPKQQRKYRGGAA